MRRRNPPPSRTPTSVWPRLGKSEECHVFDNGTVLANHASRRGRVAGPAGMTIQNSTASV
jgi:hypothetical protein